MAPGWSQRSAGNEMVRTRELDLRIGNAPSHAGADASLTATMPRAVNGSKPIYHFSPSRSESGPKFSESPGNFCADLNRFAPALAIGARNRRLSYSLSARSEEHTSELQSLMRISYAVFCLTKKKT